jgi:hypothetical protein
MKIKLTDFHERSQNWLHQRQMHRENNIKKLILRELSFGSMKSAKLADECNYESCGKTLNKFNLKSKIPLTVSLTLDNIYTVTPAGSLHQGTRVL